MEAAKAQVRNEKWQKDIQSMQAKKRELEAILRMNMDEKLMLQKKLVRDFV